MEDYKTLHTVGVYDLLVGRSLREPDRVGNIYLIYNSETDVVEEEVTYAPQAYNYVEQLAAEWDARIQSAELEEEEADGKVKSIGSLRKTGAYEH